MDKLMKPGAPYPTLPHQRFAAGPGFHVGAPNVLRPLQTYGTGLYNQKLQEQITSDCLQKTVGGGSQLKRGLNVSETFQHKNGNIYPHRSYNIPVQNEIVKLKSQQLFQGKDVWRNENIPAAQWPQYQSIGLGNSSIYAEACYPRTQRQYPSYLRPIHSYNKLLPSKGLAMGTNHTGRATFLPTQPSDCKTNPKSCQISHGKDMSTSPNTQTDQVHGVSLLSKRNGAGMGKSDQPPAKKAKFNVGTPSPTFLNENHNPIGIQEHWFNKLNQGSASKLSKVGVSPHSKTSAENGSKNAMTANKDGTVNSHERPQSYGNGTSSSTVPRNFREISAQRITTTVLSLTKTYLPNLREIFGATWFEQAYPCLPDNVSLHLMKKVDCQHDKNTVQFYLENRRWFCDILNKGKCKLCAMERTRLSQRMAYQGKTSLKQLKSAAFTESNTVENTQPGADRLNSERSLYPLNQQKQIENNNPVMGKVHLQLETHSMPHLSAMNNNTAVMSDARQTESGLKNVQESTRQKDAVLNKQDEVRTTGDLLQDKSEVLKKTNEKVLPKLSPRQVKLQFTSGTSSGASKATNGGVLTTFPSPMRYPKSTKQQLASSTGAAIKEIIVIDDTDHDTKSTCNMITSDFSVFNVKNRPRDDVKENDDCIAIRSSITGVEANTDSTTELSLGEITKQNTGSISDKQQRPLSVESLSVSTPMSAVISGNGEMCEGVRSGTMNSDRARSEEKRTSAHNCIEIQLDRSKTITVFPDGEATFTTYVCSDDEEEGEITTVAFGNEGWKALMKE